MKHIKKFQTNADYEIFKDSSNWIIPNISHLSENDNIVFGQFIPSSPTQKTLIIFTVNGIEYQAEEAMTFYDWALSDYFDSSCNLSICFDGGLRNEIIEYNISSGDSCVIMYGAGSPLRPSIDTDTIIQPISYMPNFSDFD